MKPTSTNLAYALRIWPVYKLYSESRIRFLEKTAFLQQLKKLALNKTSTDRTSINTLITRASLKGGIHRLC